MRPGFRRSGSACRTYSAIHCILPALWPWACMPFFFFFFLAHIGLYKFAADSLEATAHGYLEPPEIQSPNTSWVMLKLFLLIVGLYFMLSMVAFTGSVGLTGLVAVILAISFPAAIMILVMSNSLPAALNPIAWFTIISRMGLGYFIAVALLLLLMISQAVAESLLANLAGFSRLSAIGFFVIGAYFVIASFHLMGYLIYQNHEELGVEPRAPQARGEGSDGGSPLLAQVRGFIKEGRRDEAIDHLRRALNQGGLPEEHDKYRQLLSLKGDKKALLEHAREYIPVLLYGHEQDKKAMNLAVECLNMDPSFRPKEAKQVLDLARIMDRLGDHESIIRLTNGFAQQHPHHPDVAENYFLAARALWFGRGKGEQAKRIVSQLIKRYPDHPQVDAMQRLAEQLSSDPGVTASFKPS